MTRQTRVGLLLGLIFIMAFGIVLSELKGTGEELLPPGEDQTLIPVDTTPTAQPPQPPLSIGPVGEEDVDDPEHYAHNSPTGTNQNPDDGVVELRIVPRRPRGQELARAQIIRREQEEPVRPRLAPPVPQPVEQPAPRREDVIYDDQPNFDPAPPVARQPQPTASESQPRQRRQQPQEPATRTYRVQDNDTLFGIAERFYGPGKGHLYSRIAEANDLRNARALRPGQKLMIPPVDGQAPPRRVASQTNRREMTMDELARHVGATEVLRADPDAPRPTLDRRTGGRVYVVQSGDSLWKIAKRFYNDTRPGTIERIYRANRDRMADKHTVPVGAKLQLPG